MSDGFQVVEDLCAFDVCDVRQRFQFHHNVAEAHEICLVKSLQLISLVEHGKFLLPFKRNLPQAQLYRQCLLVNRLQKSASELFVNLHRHADDLVSLRIAVLIAFHLRNLCHLRIAPDSYSWRPLRLFRFRS